MRKSIRHSVLLILVPCSALLFNLLAAQEEPGPVYSGANQCRKCHIERYKTWKADGHSKAFEYITEEQRKDPLCLKCHATAYDSGGFVSMEETAHLSAVQCEECHGPGKDHIPIMSKLKKEKAAKEDYPEDMKINKRPAGCIKCHSPHQEHVPVEK